MCRCLPLFPLPLQMTRPQSLGGGGWDKNKGTSSGQVWTRHVAPAAAFTQPLWLVQFQMFHKVHIFGFFDPPPSPL